MYIESIFNTTSELRKNLRGQKLRQEVGQRLGRGVGQGLRQRGFLKGISPPI